MDIGAIGKMLGMARGQERLGQEPAQDAAQQQGKIDPELLKKLLDMLSAGTGGAQGGGGSGPGVANVQLDEEQINKMMSGRQGMEAMMPDSDSGRRVQA